MPKLSHTFAWRCHRLYRYKVANQALYVSSFSLLDNYVDLCPDQSFAIVDSNGKKMCMQIAERLSKLCNHKIITECVGYRRDYNSFIPSTI